jgi:hypothetical protein
MAWYDIFTGTKGKYKKKSLLREEQEPLANQAIQAGLQPGAGGAFGTAADYYRDLLSNDPETLKQLSAPELRRFNEDIIPGLAEQYSGYGGIGSSGFRNASTNAATDLSERLGAMRANLRQQGAHGLQNIGQQGLQQFDQNVYEPGTPGLLDYAGQAIGNAGTQAIGGFATNWLNSKFSTGQNKVGKNTSWKGNPQQMNQSQNIMNSMR